MALHLPMASRLNLQVKYIQGPIGPAVFLSHVCLPRQLLTLLTVQPLRAWSAVWKLFSILQPLAALNLKQCIMLIKFSAAHNLPFLK